MSVPFIEDDGPLTAPQSAARSRATEASHESGDSFDDESNLVSPSSRTNYTKTTDASIMFSTKCSGDINPPSSNEVMPKKSCNTKPPPSKKAMRAWCRSKWGAKWWKTSDKKSRLLAARDALGVKTSCSGITAAASVGTDNDVSLVSDCETSAIKQTTIKVREKKRQRGSEIVQAGTKRKRTSWNIILQKSIIAGMMRLWPEKSPVMFVNDDGSETTEQEEMLNDMETIMRGREPDYMNPYGADDRENFNAFFQQLDVEIRTIVHEAVQQDIERGGPGFSGRAQLDITLKLNDL